MVNLDSFELAILEQLQTDASLSIQEIASRVGLSQNPCWRRIRKLEEDGFIKKRVALIDREKLDRAITVYVSVRTNQHDDDWLDRFSEGVRSIPEVVEFYRMSGHVDYMLKVLVRDVAAYDAVYKRLIRLGGLSDVTSSFAMEELKYTTAIPLVDPTD